MKLFNDMKIKMLRFFQNEEGASAIEYAVIAGLIALAIIGAVTALGGDITTLFEDIAAGLSGAEASGGEGTP